MGEDEEKGTLSGEGASKYFLLERALTTHFQRIDPDRMVEVRLRGVCYKTPVSTEPAIATVYNQSIFYALVKGLEGLWGAVKDRRRILAKVRFGADVFGPAEDITLLHDVNLCLKPGRAYLILGPSGCGKTSLLEAIAGRLQTEGESYGSCRKTASAYLTGRVEYNGLALEDDPSIVVQNIVSFVTQLDQHEPLLTVRETFNFAHQCRVIDDDDNQKGRKVYATSENMTIEGLGLAHVADTFVGDGNTRGVSGGQRRRVTVGEMMQGQNPVACADEISTGLDAATTHDIVESIVMYSKAARTTRIISLLQPGRETLFLFDELILLAEGRVVYSGPVREAESYFASIGYKRPPNLDLGDFLNTLCTPEGGLYYQNSTKSALSTEELADSFRRSVQYRSIMNALNSPYERPWRLETQQECSTRASVVDEAEVVVGGGGPIGKEEPKTPAYVYKVFQNRRLESISICAKRFLTIWLRDKGFIIGKALENLGMACATGGILFGQAKLSDPPTEDNIMAVSAGVYSAIFMATFHIILGTSTSVPDDFDVRPIHYKHHDAKFYSVSSFVAAKIMSSLPQRAIEILIFGTSLYWLAGFSANFGDFIVYLLLLFSYTVCVRNIFTILVYALRGKGQIQGIATFSVLNATLFCGFMVFRSVIPPYFVWILWCNPMFWAFQGLASNEFMSSKYDVGYGEYDHIGDALLESYDFEVGREWIGYSFLFLWGFSLLAGAVLCFFMAFERFYPTKVPPKPVIFPSRDPFPLHTPLLAAGDSANHSAENGQEEDERGEVRGTEGGEQEVLNNPFTPVDLTFEKIVYEVQASTGSETLRLLNEVSGCLRAGRMCALMGSSGAGKTTLMDVIAQRKVGGTISGDIRMNGFLQERTAFLRSSGYVEQFDIQQPELTVYESVIFSARLRLESLGPGAIDDAAKLRFVGGVLSMMELTSIRDQQVGNFTSGGLSFEQRKRLAIALELAGSPSIIFLDEPTSGLDARGALLVMRAMRRITETGRTVCATIHQPSAAVFSLFDDLLLLKRGGNVVYFGELGEGSSTMIRYFESRGANPIQEAENPAVWVLRESTDESGDTNWADVYRTSEESEALHRELVAIKECPDPSSEIRFSGNFAAGKKQRAWLMIKRALTVYKRSPAYNLGRVTGACVYALLMGLIFAQKSWSDEEWSTEEAASLINVMFVALIVMGITCITMAVPVARQFRDVFYKHRASGMILAHEVAPALAIGEFPYIISLSFLFSLLFWATNGLFSQGGSFTKFFGFFTANAATYTYFGQAFMCLVKDIPTAGALMGALIGTNVFFSGLIVKPQQFKGFPFELGYWIAPGRYAYEGLIVSMLDRSENTIVADPEGLFARYLDCEPDSSSCSGTMSQFLDFYFGGKFTRSHILLDSLVCGGYLLVALLATWFALHKFNYVNT